MPRCTAVLLFFVVSLAGFGQQTATASESAKATLPPGISLPRTGTAFAVDKKAGEFVTVPLHATEIVSNSHAAGNFARSQVFMNVHASTELAGTGASVNLVGQQPSFLVRINADDPELTRRRVQLIRLTRTKDRRVVSKYSQNVFGGSRQRNYDLVATTKADVDPDVWLMVTPDAPLTPGEYGIVFVPKDANFSVDAVYDFSVGADKGKP